MHQVITSWDFTFSEFVFFYNESSNKGVTEFEMEKNSVGEAHWEDFDDDFDSEFVVSPQVGRDGSSSFSYRKATTLR